MYPKADRSSTGVEIIGWGVPRFISLVGSIADSTDSVGVMIKLDRSTVLHPVASNNRIANTMGYSYRCLRKKQKSLNMDFGPLIELSDGVFVISQRRSQVDEVAIKLAQEWQDSGESLESMLTTLREVRSEYDDKKP